MEKKTKGAARKTEIHKRVEFGIQGQRTFRWGGEWSAVSSAAERSTWARDRAIGLVTLEFNGDYHWRIWLDSWCISRDFDLISMG